MVKIYVNKILNGEINLNTGNAWTLEDVPIRWRSKVAEALEN